MGKGKGAEYWVAVDLTYYFEAEGVFRSRQSSY